MNLCVEHSAILHSLRPLYRSAELPPHDLSSSFFFVINSNLSPPSRPLFWFEEKANLDNSRLSLSSCTPYHRLTMTTSLTQHQLYQLEITERVASCFSLVGTLFVFVTFMYSPAFRKPINRLLFFATWGNLAYNVHSSPHDFQSSILLMCK